MNLISIVSISSILSAVLINLIENRMNLDLWMYGWPWMAPLCM